jgi:hypothetical protein
MLARLRPSAKLSLAGLGRLSVSKHSLWFDLINKTLYAEDHEMASAIC